MPEETPVVTASGGDTATPAQGGDTPQAAPAAAQEPSEPITFSFADDTASGGVEDNNGDARVPSSRLREESDKRRATEAQNAQLQQQNTMMQAMLRNATNQPQAQPQPAAGDDPLRTPFGADADGQMAHDAVKNLSAAEARVAVDQAKGELRQEFNNKFTQQFGGITASLQLSTKLNEMQQAGMIDETASRVIGQRVGEFVAQQPGWSNHQELVADKVWADMMRRGEIKAARRVNPSSPSGNSIHQPGGPGGGGPSAEDLRQMQDNKIGDLRARFPRSFQNQSDDQLRASLGDVTHDVTPTVEAPDPSTGEVAPHMTFVHTRG